MTQTSKGPGGCIVTILIILVIAAAFGLIEWSTVGSFARLFVAFLIGIALFFIGMMRWGKVWREEMVTKI